MRNVLKKVILGLVLSVTLVTSFVPQPALAYDSTQEGTTNEHIIFYYPYVYRPAIEADEMNLESFVNETLKGVFFGFPVYLINKSLLLRIPYEVFILVLRGAMPIVDAVEWGLNAFAGLFSDGSAAPFPINFIAKAYEKQPVSAIEYVKDVAIRLDIVEPTFAQGFGYNSLTGIVDYWRVFRNGAYAISAIFVIIAAFMVMFQIKVSPQAVVTVQMIIPRLITALLLVTFSYAIAGFILDMVWFVTMFLFKLLEAGGFFHDPVMYEQALTSESVITFYIRHHIMETLLLAFGSLADLVSSIAGGLSSISFYGFLIFGGLLAILISLLLALIKIAFNVIKAYIMILLYTIFGPLMIMTGVIPTVQGYGGWLKNMIANAMVFPITAILMVIASNLMHGGNTAMGQVYLPLMGQLDPTHLVRLSGLGMLLFAPSITDTLGKALRVGSLAAGSAMMDPMLRQAEGRMTTIGQAPGRIIGTSGGVMGYNALSSSNRPLARAGKYTLASLFPNLPKTASDFAQSNQRTITKKDEASGQPANVDPRSLNEP